jgi:hypothetical protein
MSLYCKLPCNRTKTLHSARYKYHDIHVLERNMTYVCWLKQTSITTLHSKTTARSMLSHTTISLTGKKVLTKYNPLKLQLDYKSNNKWYQPRYHILALNAMDAHAPCQHPPCLPLNMTAPTLGRITSQHHKALARITPGLNRKERLVAIPSLASQV